MPFFIPVAIVFGGVYLMEQILGAGDKRRRFEEEYVQPRIYYPTKRILLQPNEDVKNKVLAYQWNLALPYFGKDRRIWKQIHLEERVVSKEIRDIPSLDDGPKLDSPSNESAKTWILSEYESKTSPLPRGVNGSPILKAMSAPSTPTKKDD